MGCDIHAYIDYDESVREDKTYTNHFGHVRLGRNYTVFALMSGTRYDERTDMFKPLFEPRGLPNNISFWVLDEYTLYVLDDPGDEEGYCSSRDANRWVEQGISKWWGEDHKRITHPDWHSASWLTVDELKRVREAYENIEFPEMSWFQSKSPELQPIPENAVAIEMDRQLFGGSEWFVEVGEKKTYSASPTLNAVIAAMEALDGDTPGRSRLVFWYDN